jgi:hypothetical protein
LEIPVKAIQWLPCWRIIPSRFPPINLFERVANPEDWEALCEIESLTNPRLRDEVGSLQLVPVEERVSGPGSSVIMAAFTHLSPEGNRFTNGSYGVFYAGRDLKTAIDETVFHREHFMKATAQPRMELDMRVYAVDLDGRLHDVRNKQKILPGIYNKSAYDQSQSFAKRLRDGGSSGIVYDSVRREGGECVAVFRPCILSNTRQERHLCYSWNGLKITNVYEKSVLLVD